MDVSNFFSRFLQAPKQVERSKLPDDPGDFEAAWTAIKETLEHPDERQLLKGISSTEVPAQLRHIVDALVYEANRTDEDTPGACLEYFLRNDLLSQLERLCEADRPHGIKGEVLKAINNLVVLLSERFLVQNAVHRPLRRLLRSCVGEEPEERVDGQARVLGAAGMRAPQGPFQHDEDLEADLVDLMCILCSRMRAYPPLLMIFFHDKGWLHPHPSIGSPPPLNAVLARAISPSPSGVTRRSDPSTRTPSKASQNFEFLLFSYLLRFVHREGRTGDFARAGLLFLFDIAFLTPQEEGGENLSMRDDRGIDPLQDARDALGEFILDGDFADVMAAGLGAVYSLLPSKLRVPPLAEQIDDPEGAGASASGGMHLGASMMEEEPAEHDLPISTEGSTRSQLDLLLKLFGFLQDIIHRCSSPMHYADPDSSAVTNTHVLGSAISDATVEAIRLSFLDNVLYPSVLECSPLDGSSVAVLTYLDAILGNLDDGPLLDSILDFLMDQDSTTAIHSHQQPKRRTGAMDFVAPHATPQMDYYADEGRFTLKDLIMDNLRSDVSSSSTAALRLIQTLLSEHCKHSIKGMLDVMRDPAATAIAHRPILDMPIVANILPTPATSIDPSLQEVELYGSLTSRLDPSLASVETSAGYANYLQDAVAGIQAESCFHNTQTSMTFLESGEKMVSVLKPGHDCDPHRLKTSDGLLRLIFQSLGNLLAQSPDENVALTGVIAQLCYCPVRSPAGWLTYDLSTLSDPWRASGRPLVRENDAYSDDSSDDGQLNPELIGGSKDPFEARSQIELPALYQIVRDLVRQVSGYRDQVSNFDQLLTERRQGLLFADHLDEAMNLMLDVESTNPVWASPPSASTPSAKRPSALSSLRSFLTPKRKSTPSGTPIASNRSATLVEAREQPDAPVTPPRSRQATADVAPSPFMSHYDQTSALMLEAEPCPVRSGPWAASTDPPHESGIDEALTSPTRSTLQYSQRPPDDGESSTRVPLSRILDNCVILEEFIKELVAIIVARRALGIDQVAYL